MKDEVAPLAEDLDFMRVLDIVLTKANLGLTSFNVDSMMDSTIETLIKSGFTVDRQILRKGNKKPELSYEISW